MSALKDNVDAAAVARIAGALDGAVPGFDAPGFTRAAGRGLGALELKARLAQVSAALASSIGAPFAVAGPAVVAAVDVAGLGVWEAWPVVDWVPLAAPGDPVAAAPVLGALTRHASAEFAVRPYLRDDAEGMRSALDEWSVSDDEHRRRLASEGTRPLLPWAPRIGLEPVWAVWLLDRLRDDQSPYVRKSVANHLNDLCKVSPSLALSVAGRWRGEGGSFVDRSIEHGLRTLLKAGDPDALRLTGVDASASVRASLALSPDAVPVGGAISITAALKGEGRVLVDYLVAAEGSGRAETAGSGRAAAGSGRAPRRFAVGPVDLPASLTRRHVVRALRNRPYEPGPHRLSLRVNGHVVASGTFEVL